MTTKAKTTSPAMPKMPSGGTIIPAGPGYSVLTAIHDEVAGLVFPPALPVIAWSIGGDGMAYPVTAMPIDERTIDVGTVHTNGAVVDIDGTWYPGTIEWQDKHKADEATAKAEADAKAKEEADAKAHADAEAKAKADAKAEAANHKTKTYA